MASIETTLLDLSARVERLETVEAAGYFMPLVTVAGAQPYAVNATVMRSPILRPITFRRIIASVNVTAPNDAFNYWTINLSAQTAGIISAVNTAIVTPAVWTTLTNNSFSPNTLATTEPYLAVDLVATGAPGPIALAVGVYVI